MRQRRMVTRRELLVGAAVGAAASALRFPVNAAPRVSPVGTIIEGSSQEPVNYNPLLYVNTGTETAIDQAVFSRLWQINDRGQFFPLLAAEIPSKQNGGISHDELTYTIRLRRDASWHDGQPVMAKDVAFTYETIMNPKLAVRSQAGHDRVKSYRVIDDYTVAFTLKERFVPYLIAWQAMSPIPEHIFAKEADINTSRYNTEPVGSGPFRFVERKAGDYIRLEAFDKYFGDGPYLREYIYKYIPDLTVLYTRWKIGEIQVVGIQGIPADRVQEAQHLPGHKVYLTPSPFVEFIYFNLGKPMFQDRRVRQAIYVAIDKDAWINEVYYGIHKRTLSYLPPDHWAYNRELKDPGYHPERAAALLDEAGWRVGADGIRQKDGVRLSFTNSTTAGNKQREQAQQLIQANLRKVGIDMRVKNMPASVVWGEYTTKSQFDTLMVGWDPPLYPDPDYAARAASSQIPVKTGHGSNYVQYSNPVVDRLFDDGVRESEREKRRAIYWKIQEALLEDLPFAPIFSYNNAYGATTTLLDYRPNPYVTENNWNCYAWRLAKTAR